MRWTDLGWRALPAALLIAAPAAAQGLPPLDAHGAWVRAARSGDGTAMFLTLRDVGATPDRLLGASCPLAAHTVLQAPGSGGGLQDVAALPLPGDGALTLAPGGAQITLSGLKQTLAVGTYLPCTIRLQAHGERIVEALVAPADAVAAPASP